MISTFAACGSDNRTDRVVELDNYNIDNSDSYYETAEDGSTHRWEIKSGWEIENVEGGANDSDRSIFFRRKWSEDENGNLKNDSHYELSLYNDYQFILELDKKKKSSNRQYCLTIGVKVDTYEGERYLSFNTFYDKENMEADIQTLDGDIPEMVFPLSMDYVNIGGIWTGLRFDLSQYLHQFEPNNEITAVTAFYFQGGDDYLDNIRLVSE